IGAVCLKTKNAKDKKRKFKAILIVPGIHPGPFGYVGGSNLPIKLAKELRQISNNVMVFHGASTHDYNPVKSAELTKIVHELKNIILTKKPSYSSNSSQLIRLRSSVGSIQICAQILGNGVLIVYTSSPESTDDLDYGIGENAVLDARQRLKFADNALFIDSHNCLEKGVGSVAVGSKKSDEILRLIAKSITSLNDGYKGVASSSPPPKLKAGFASNNSFSIKDGIGPQGIQVLAIEALNRAQGDTTSTPHDSKQKVANILIDGNNIMPKLREQILENIRDLVDEAEVFTSDNHVVNITMGGYNPVGLKGSPKKIIAVIQELVSEALQDLEEVEVRVNSGRLKNLKVFGHGNTLRLSKTINKTLSIMGKSLVACNVLAIIGCITLYILI
ncbi:MAG: DUF2070 family protein, partial [Thermoplasmata archaeon]|nr:DUF2070 family protein [Thermoplasmata archaeon]